MERITLREAREQHDPPLTQEALEALCGVPQNTISGIETGRVKNPGASTVEKLEVGLGLERGTLRFELDAEKQTRLPLKRKAS